MTLRDELREVFARVKSGRPPRDRLSIAAALDLLPPATVALLAGYDGQSLDELETSFQLLPLGTRFALEEVHAIQQSDDGAARFHVTATPLALELVRAASIRISEERSTEASGLLNDEMDRVRAENFEVVAADEDATKAAREIPAMDLVGMFHAEGEVTIVDTDHRLAALILLSREGRGFRNECSLQLRLAHSADLPMPGERVDLKFALALPHATGSQARPGIAQKLTDELKRSVKDRVGALPIQYKEVPRPEQRVLKGGRLRKIAKDKLHREAYIADDLSQANGVAQLAAVHSHDGKGIPIHIA